MKCLDIVTFIIYYQGRERIFDISALKDVSPIFIMDDMPNLLLPGRK